MALGIAPPHARCALGQSASAFAIAGIAILMAHDENPDAFIDFSIDERVRITHKRKRPPTVPGWCTEAGIGFKKPSDAPELLEKPASHTLPHFDLVVAKRFGKVGIRLAMERSDHLSSASSLARTSSTETSEAVPA